MVMHETGAMHARRALPDIDKGPQVIQVKTP